MHAPTIPLITNNVKLCICVMVKTYPLSYNVLRGIFRALFINYCERWSVKWDYLRSFLVQQKNIMLVI